MVNQTGHWSPVTDIPFCLCQLRAPDLNSHRCPTSFRFQFGGFPLSRYFTWHAQRSQGQRNSATYLHPIQRWSSAYAMSRVLPAKGFRPHNVQLQLASLSSSPLYGMCAFQTMQTVEAVPVRVSSFPHLIVSFALSHRTCACEVGPSADQNGCADTWPRFKPIVSCLVRSFCYLPP